MAPGLCWLNWFGNGETNLYKWFQKIEENKINQQDKYHVESRIYQEFGLSQNSEIFQDREKKGELLVHFIKTFFAPNWVCLKMGYTPNEIVI